MKIRACLELVRPLNCAMASVGVFIGYSIAFAGFTFNLSLATAMLAAFLVCGAGQAVNDYFDRSIDAKASPNKPIPSGRVSPAAALALGIALFAAGCLLAVFLNTAALTIVVAFSILLFAYSAFLPRLKFFGNLAVAAGTAFTLVFGASLLLNFTVVAFLAASAFFANLAREIIKDIEDREADKGHKLTLPLLLDIRLVKSLVLLFYLAAISIVYFPFINGWFGNIYFLPIVSIANIAFLYSFKKALSGQYHAAQQLSKKGMLIALLAFLAGVI